MSWFYLGILLVYGLLILPKPSEAFISRSAGCHHNGTWYADKSLVPTVEKCLNCQCNKKTLVCRLKVCPEMPMPPPRGCVVVQKKTTCCPYLSCARLEAFYKIPITRRIIAYLDHYERESIDRVVNDNMLQRRSDDSETDLLVCVKNGTVYKSGSAMSSSNLCSYCYCIGGTEKCVKPKCMLPVEGCKPIFVDSTCCPVRYDCSVKTSGKSSQEVRYRKTANKHFLRMSQRLQRNRGCTVNKQFYAEGQKMKSDPDKPCDICFCIRGFKRCAPKKCSPALKNCIPVVPKGQCCPSSYDCGSQRDYRRSHNSRQFNLFSLLFGKDENTFGPSTVISEHYPHDRDPALVTAATKYKTHEEALEASSEKSILDTLREGLEFIDGNTNHMIEENFDLVNLQAKRESIPAVETTTSSPYPGDMSSTTELSFLDLILGEESDIKNDPEHIDVSSPSAPVQDELSWVDILLGPSEDQQNNTRTMDLDSEINFQLTTPSVNIDRLDTNVDDLGTSGEIFVGTTAALTETSTAALMDSVTEGNKTEDFLPDKIENKNETQVVNEVDTLINKTTTKPKQPIIRPIPLQNLSEGVEKTDKIPILEPHQPSKPPIGIKPTQKNGLLTALLDGISNILDSQNTENSTTTIPSVVLPNTTQTTMMPTKPLPIFKPLPTEKTPTHIRVNSKIANLITSSPSPIRNNEKIENVSFKPLPSVTTKQENKLNLTTPKPSRKPSTTTTTSTTQKPKITITTTTTTKPLIIKTNPSILEVDPLDDSTEPTLPPSLPNLKIIPFLPTDAVEAANTKIFEYFPGGAPLYDDAKLYPAITEHYSSYPVDLEDDNKAKYIYKFKVEGPESEPMPVAIPKNPNDGLGVDSFLNYELPEKNGFSPPTKTEGGFVPKEPLPVDDEILESGEFNVSKLNEIFPATMHIIDITTPESFHANLTKFIDITTPDPFKDVIHTEHPPDLTEIIKDKEKIEALVQQLQNKTIVQPKVTQQQLSAKNATESINVNSAIKSPSTKPTLHQNKNSIASLLDILFKEEEEELSSIQLEHPYSTSTIPPFKSLPQSTMMHFSTKTATTPTIRGLESTTTASPSTRKPLRSKPTSTSVNKNRTRPTVASPQKPQRLKANKTTSTTQAPKQQAKISTTTVEPISTPIKTTRFPVSTVKTTKSTLSNTSTAAAKKATTTTTTTNKPTKNPFLMSPFDKLPFMDASFEIKRQMAATSPTSSTISYSLERLEGLDAAYDISNAITSTTTTTTTSSVHPPYGPINDKHSISTSNNLIDPTGILKLAGCNIYGRMYRVGRIILELSSPCVECKCTETGVKCGQLDC